ncbi:MAG TPA: ABC transporter ATP-binding protein [Aggregatilineaceae bacterium]|jgi:ABC-2 type transport system ATP-binding protein|nr:ABC transporter ATP-binding protein [Aggregatilineaceae bacterium]
MDETVAIRIANLSKTFGLHSFRKRRRVDAVKHLNLEVQAGQVYGFLGPNGAGKSTTIRMLLDLILPTSGSAYVYGQHVRRQHSILRRVGAIVEGASFYGFLSGRRNLEVLARTANQYDARRIEALLEQVGLAERATQRVKGYSTGMKQRLGLAAALLTDPDLLILDEPTNGLDPSGMHEIRGFIRELVDKHGKTVFLSSHLLSEVEQVCDRVAIIHMGEIVREGAVKELLAGKSNLRVEAAPLDRAAAVLRDHWTVSANGQWLTVDAGREDVPDVVRRLVESDVDVYEVASQRQTLEEYFLAVVGEETQHA